MIINSRKCIFLDYKFGIKGYKFKCLKTSKAVISGDLVFDEHTMAQNLRWKDFIITTKKEQSTQVELEIVLGSKPESSAQSSLEVK